MSKSTYIQITLAILLLVSIVIIGLFLTFSPKKVQQKNQPIPSPIQKQIDSPLERIQEASTNETLSPKKLLLREQLIVKLNGKSGILYRGTTFDVYYLFDENVFEMRLKTSNIDQAKKDGVSWLEEQGFNKNDLCSLPVMYYISPRGLQILNEQGKQFNPIPDGC